MNWNAATIIQIIKRSDYPKAEGETIFAYQ